MRLEKVVPFGRSLDEYIKMFDLSQSDFQSKILGVGDGPASFNAEATQLGYHVTSIDPIYQFTGAEIFARFQEVVDGIIEQVRQTPNDWVWKYHKSPEDLRQNRVQAIEKFLKDYDLAKQIGRYKLEELPKLSFADKEYDLALCSHFLLLYSDFYDYQFHLNSILEMMRVATEVRIFPLLTLMLQRSPHLNPLIAELTQLGYTVEIKPVAYQLQKGGHEMLVVKRNGNKE
ncbi:SAM-dependent methyltransferase [Merismopedia glauca]|nr:SAM-dependent methyltransferase [Merismopedia glauca]